MRISDWSSDVCSSDLAKSRADRSRRHPVLPRAGFCDDARLAHPDRQQDLPDAVVDLVGTGVIEFVTLEPDLRSAERRCQAGRAVKRVRAADIMFEPIVKLGCSD